MKSKKTPPGIKRRPRYEQQYPNIDLILGEKDLRFLNLLYKYRVLNTEQIKALMPDWSESALNKRLTDLYHHGYCDRPEFQVYLQISKKQSWQMIYAPTRKGIKAIAVDTKTDYKTKNAKLTPAFTNHRLGINQLNIALHKALEDHDSLIVDWWLFDKEWGTQLKMPHREGYRTVKLFPDSFFALYDKARQANKNQLSFFLEWDNGTEDHAKLIAKMMRYSALATSGQLQAPRISRKPIPVFRPLFVLNSKQRLNNLLDRLHKVELNKRQWFYFTTQDEITLTDPQNVLKPIWKCLQVKGSGPKASLNGRIEVAEKSILG